MSERPWYKWWEWFAPIIIIILLLIPYIPWQRLPDLLIENYTTEWPSGGGYVVHVTVKNDGSKKSPMCWIFCNAICRYPPEGQEGQDPIRDQRYYLMEELQPGETAAYSFSFDVKVLMNENVDQLIIIVDGTYYVEESNEENNFEYFIWSS